MHDQASLGSYVGAQEGSGSQLGNASYVNHMEAQAISYLKDQVNKTNLPPGFHLLVPFCIRVYTRDLSILQTLDSSFLEIRVIHKVKVKVIPKQGILSHLKGLAIHKSSLACLVTVYF